MNDETAPIHPGEILREQLAKLGLSANALATALRVPANRITSILNAQRSISPDTALRLARYLGTTAEFWMNLQSAYDLKVAEIYNGERIISEVQTRPSD